MSCDNSCLITFVYSILHKTSNRINDFKDRTIKRKFFTFATVSIITRTVCHQSNQNFNSFTVEISIHSPSKFAVYPNEKISITKNQLAEVTISKRQRKLFRNREIIFHRISIESGLCFINHMDGYFVATLCISQCFVRAIVLFVSLFS